jgi:flagellar hook-associated protein 2
MSTISASSNLDVNGIVSQLMQIERRPLQSIQNTLSGIQTKLSAFGKLQSSLSAFQDAARALTRTDTWGAAKASSSDETAMTASAGSGAIPGGYSIEVSQLAQRQTIATGTYADGAAVVGGGTLRIRMGSLDAAETTFSADPERAEVSIAIAPGATLADVRNAINAAGAGVTASLVADGSGQRLMLRSADTGAMQAFSIAADSDGSGGGGLSALAFDPAGGASPAASMVRTQSAQDALVTVNGLQVSAKGNRLEGVVENVSIELKRVTTAPVEITVASDAASLRGSLDAFVKAYNEVNRQIADQTRYDPATKIAGPLQGNQTALRMQQQLREILRSTAGTGSPNSLNALGIELQRDGSLAITGIKLDAALASPGTVKSFFAATGATPQDAGLAQRLITKLGDLLSGDGALPGATDSLKSRQRSAEQQQERINSRLTDIEKRLVRQYTALDANLSRITGSFAGIQGLLNDNR